MLSQIVNNFNDILKNKKFKMPIIAVYNSPADFKDKYVARLYDLDQATPYAVIADDLPSIHKVLPSGLTLIPRSPEDVKSLVETWI